MNQQTLYKGVYLQTKDYRNTLKEYRPKPVIALVRN